MASGALSERIAVITGASAGIGAAIARDLAAAGAKLVLNARREDRIESLAAEIGRERVRVVSGDAGEPETVTRMLDAAVDHFGKEADLVVANAGRGLRGSVLDSDPAQWEEVVRINLLGAARLMREAVERMRTLQPPVEPAKGGRPAEYGPPSVPRDLLVIGSTVGRHVSPFSSFYGATKAAVHMLAESLRRVAGPMGIRVTLIEPGIVKSEFQEVASYDPASFGAFMGSISPVLEPADIARLVTFITSQPAGVHINDVMIRPTRQEYP